MKGNLLTILVSPISLLTFGHFVADLYAGFIFPILPVISDRLNISLPMIGLIIALSSLSASVLQPIYGYYSDKISRRVFVIWGMIISSFFISFVGDADSYYTLAICIILGNLGVGFYHPQATALTGKLKTNNQNFNMGIFVAGGTVGYALGPMLSSSLVYYWGLKSILAACIPGILTAFLFYLFLPKINLDKENVPLAATFQLIKDNFSNLIPLIITIIIRAIILMSLSLYLPFEWENNLKYPVITVGIIMMIYSLFGGTFSVLGGSLASKVGERRLLLLSFIIPLPLFLLSLYFIKEYSLISSGLYILGGAIMLSAVSIGIIIAQRIVHSSPGVISGITGGFCWGFAGFLMYPLGAIMKVYGICNVLFYTMFLAIIAIICVLLISKDVFKIDA